MMNLNIVWIAIGAAVTLIIATAIIWLTLANDHLRSQVAVLQGGVATCRLANDEMRDKIAQQNRAIAAWRQAEAARAAAAGAALQKAQVRSAQWMRQADAWLRTQTTGDDCAAAQKLMRDYLSDNTTPEGQ